MYRYLKGIQLIPVILGSKLWLGPKICSLLDFPVDIWEIHKMTENQIRVVYNGHVFYTLVNKIASYCESNFIKSFISLLKQTYSDMVSVLISCSFWIIMASNALKCFISRSFFIQAVVMSLLNTLRRIPLVPWLL